MSILHFILFCSLYNLQLRFARCHTKCYTYLLIGEQTLGKLIRAVTFLLDNKAQK